MNPRYAEWIAALNLPTTPTGLCAVVTSAMAHAFPELRRVRGHVVDECDERKHPHWWMETAEGEVIDPTVCQFDGMVITYEPWAEGQPEPTGKCHDCGGYVYDGSSFCSAACAQATDAWLNSQRRVAVLVRTRDA